MRKTTAVFFFFIAAGLLAACASQAVKDIEVTTRRQPDFDPGNYRSYAWLETAQIVNDPLGQWEPPAFDADAEVTRLVDRELAKHGFAGTNSNPDLLVTFIAGIDMADLKLRDDPDKNGKETLQNIPRGALVVILVDAASLERLWVGVAMADVGRQSDSNAVRRRLDYAISGMFREFPGK